MTGSATRSNCILRVITMLLVLVVAASRCAAAGDAPAEAGAEDVPGTPGTSSAVIATAAGAASDGLIAERIRGIYAEIPPLTQLAVRVEAGVATLSGSLTSEADIARAAAIAARVAGVVAVESHIERSVDVFDNVTPLIEKLTARARRWLHALPLLVVAGVVVAAFHLLGRFIGGRAVFWNRVTGNAFLAELLSGTAHLAILMVGLVVALDLLGAGALVGAVLGGAGVIGLAVGFAVKDLVENYVASLMLSLRQPFRANDHVVIDDQEGLVIRLTSRATVLMTLDGNHLRIPNASVFKANILNYTTNPERRFDFDLGVDASDDPAAAMATGIECIEAFDFILRQPAPFARIEAVGDSNIVIRYYAWIDQRATDLAKARSAAIRAVKLALEGAGFGLPEPIYRLRFESGSPLEITRPDTVAHPPPASRMADRTTPDVAADSTIAGLVAEERARGEGEDMLDVTRPVE